MKKTIIFFILSTFLICFSSGCGQNSGNVNNNVNKSTETIENVNAQEIEEPKEPVINTARMTFTGDIMVHSYQYNEAYDLSTDTYNFMHNFTDMKKYFDKADCVIGNLETTFGGTGSVYPMFSGPDSFLDSLKYAGFDIFTTANNHCLDSGSNGLIRTLDKLDEYGFNHVGTYRTEEESQNILVQNVNGINVAFLSYTYGTNGIPIKNPYMVNIIDDSTRDKIKSDIEKARELSDIVVVMPHIGTEYKETPDDYVVSYIDDMFTWGADIVVASHPHVLLPMDYKTVTDPDGTERQCFVIYSMGNFISSQTTPPRNASILLNIDIQKVDNNRATVENVTFVPIWTQFRGTDGKDHFVVRSVYEMLTLPVDEQKALLRQKDILRLNDIHYETTKMLLNEDVPIEQIKDEYTFVRP